MSSKFRFLPLASAASLLPLLLATGANAQAIERHLPQTPQAAPSEIVAPNAIPAEQDATPIGPGLRALVLIGPQETVRASAPDGIAIGDVSRLQGSDIAGVLQPFLGKPISRKLIAEVEAAVAGHYRDLNYPFVSLSTPEQEITAGVLQIRVVEFRTGKVTVTGARNKAEAERLGRKIGLKTGDAINARELTYDLDGINRYPFRSVQAVFSPGEALGVSDLTLAARQGKRWQVYAGYNNDGSASTSFDRYFLGGAIGGLLGADSVLSAQTTVSRDLLEGEKSPHYKSAALSYTLPVGPRGQIEATMNAVTTYQAGDPFSVRLKASEGAFGYRFAFSKLHGDVGATDMRFGVEAKHQKGITYFAGVPVYDVAVEVYQLYLGYHHSGKDGFGASTFDVVAHMSPGNINAGNSHEQAILYSQGRQKGATYSYLSANYSRFTPLPNNLTLKTQASGQFASGALPRTEQAGLGGSSQVRGYTLENGAFDTALIVRNELRIPGKALGKSTQVNPFLFVDMGYGRDNAAQQSSGLASTGAGAEVRLTRYVALNVNAACALTPDRITRAGDWLVHSNLSVAF